MGRTIRIFDTTLRDGEQSPGCSMNLNEKIDRGRTSAGIDESGYHRSRLCNRFARRRGRYCAIADTVHDSTVCSLARCVEKDIDAAYNAIKRANSARIHVFLATSPLHMQYKLKMTPEEVLESVAHNVAYAKKYLDDIEFSAEDSTRSDLDFLCKVFEAAIKAGATTLNIPDTVGYMAPNEYASRVRYLREHTPGIENVILSCHCHNDLGMAVANSLAGVEAGINQIECTINGIGERAGNASMEECVMALRVRRDYYQADTNIDSTQIYRASRMIQTITGVPVAPTKPIIGANAFAHESGIHQHGVPRKQADL